MGIDGPLLLTIGPSNAAQHVRSPRFHRPGGPKPSCGAADSMGNADKVALYVDVLSHGLRLPFYCSVSDVLDFLGVGLTQVHPNARRIPTSCCVVCCMVLEATGEEYPDLIA